jgi:hypothetical protein
MGLLDSVFRAFPTWLLITQRATRRDSFQSVVDLARKIEPFVAPLLPASSSLHVDGHGRFDPRKARTT